MPDNIRGLRYQCPYKKYNNAIIQSTVGVPRYSQTTKTYYFTRTRGAKYASKITYKDSAELIALVAGFTP